MKSFVALLTISVGLTGCIRLGSERLGYAFDIENLDSPGAFKGHVYGHYSRAENSLNIHVDQWRVRFGVGSQPGRHLDNIHFELGVQSPRGYWSRGLKSNQLELDRYIRADEDVILEDLEFTIDAESAVWTQKVWLVAIYETVSDDGRRGMNFGAEDTYLFSTNRVTLPPTLVAVLQPSYDSQAQTAYISSLNNWLIKNRDIDELKPGRQPTHFEQEVAALTMMTVIWERDGCVLKTEPDQYAELVSRIAEAGFLREYVWAFKRQDHWSQPEDLETAAFDEWAAEHLRDHTAPDFGYVNRSK